MAAKRKNEESREVSDTRENYKKKSSNGVVVGGDFARFVAEQQQKDTSKEEHLSSLNELQPTPYSQLAKLDEGMNRCFRANRKRSRDAQTLLKRAKKLKEVKFFNRLIRDFGNDKQFGFAEEAFRILEKECNIEPNAYSYTNLLNACVRVGELKRAREVFQKMERDCDEKPNEVTCTVFIKGLCEEGLIDEALELVKDMVRGSASRPRANVRTFSTILRNCVRYRDVHSAEATFSLMRECFDVLPDAACYEYLSKSYASRLDVEKAEKTLNELELQQDENGKVLNIPASALASLAGVAATVGKVDVAKRAIAKCRERADEEQRNAEQFSSNANSSSEKDRSNNQKPNDDSTTPSKSVSNFFKARASDALREIVEIEAFLSSDDDVIRQEAKQRAEAFGVDETDDIVFVHKQRELAETPAIEKFWASRYERKGKAFMKAKLEVCSGHGDWITSRCAKEKETTEWFGIEMRENRVALTWIKSLRLGVRNLTMLCGLAHECMRKQIPNEVLDEIYVNFPDPPEWNGSANCLVDGAFLVESHRTLKTGAYLILVTDDPGYAMRMCRELSVVPHLFEPTATDGKPFENRLPADYGFSYFNALWTNGNLNDRYYINKSMKFDRNKDGGEDEEDRVPAAEAARRRFFPPPGKTMMNEENALRTFREGLGFKTATKKVKKQKRQSFHSASFATAHTQPMQAPTFANSPAKKASSSSFLTRTPGKKHRASDAALSFRTTTTTTQKIPKPNNFKSVSATTSTDTTTSSLTETVVMTHPDVLQRREQRDDADEMLQFLNENKENEKTRRMKKRTLLDALQTGGAGDEEAPDKNNTKPPDWIKVQRDSRNVARGEKLVANELMRAMQLDTEVNGELIPDASSLFIPTGALEQLPPFARWYWSVKSQMMDCLVCVQVGRFFNLFQNDADTGETVGLRPSGKNRGFMRKVGFPYVVFDDWCAKLIAHGYCIAKCVEGKEIDTKRKLCERKITEIITPGLNKGFVDDTNQESWVCTLAQEGDDFLGVCLIDADKGNVKFGSFKISIDSNKNSINESLVNNGDDTNDDTSAAFAKLISILTQARPKEIIISLRGPNSIRRNVKRAIQRHYESVSAGAFASERVHDQHDDVDDYDESYASHASLRNNPVVRVIERGCDPLPEISIDDVKRAIRQFAGEAEFETDTDTRRAVEGAGNAGLVALAFGIRFCAWAGQCESIFKSAKYGSLASLVNIDFDDVQNHDNNNSGPLRQRKTMLEFHGNALKELGVTDGGKKSLIGLLSRDCITPHGKRRVRDMVFSPLVQISDITTRQDTIQFLLKDADEQRAATANEHNYETREYLKRKLPRGDCERSLTKCMNLAQCCATMCAANANVLIEGTDPSAQTQCRDAVITLTAATVGGAPNSDELYGNAMESLNEGETLDDALVAFWELNQSRLDGFSKAVECLMILAKSLKGLAAFRREQRNVPIIIDKAIALGETACPLLEDLREALRVDKINDEENARRKIRIVTPDKRAFKTYARADADAVEADNERNIQRQQKQQRRDFDVEQFGMMMDDEDDDVENQMLEDERAAYLFDRADRAGARAFTTVIAQFATHKCLWRALINAGADIDALNSFARLKAEDTANDFCVPRFLSLNKSDGTPIVSLTNFWHPLLDASQRNIVKNDAQFGGSCCDNDGGQPRECPRFVLLSGPNMGGKSTLARAVGLTIVLAQVGAHVPASECVLTPIHQLVVRCGTLRDDLRAGVSTFLAETQACATAMKVANKNTTSLMIMDEIGQGTSTSDGYAIASAVARALMKSNTAITLFTTHFHDLHENLASSSALRFASCHMSSEINEKTRDVVRYNYKLCDGSAPFEPTRSGSLQTTRVLAVNTKRTKNVILSNEALSAFKQLLRDPGVNGEHIANEREWCIEFYQYWKYVERLLAL
ncbi:unnamed protein product [Bathycoccus prasinos]